MGHWTEKYLDYKYVQGQADCATLVKQVIFDRMGIEVNLPAERDWRRLSPQQILAMHHLRGAQVDKPGDCDLVLMKIQGNTRSFGSHIGLSALVAGRVWVLHAVRGIGAVFHPIGQLPQYRLELVGYYSLVTIAIP